MLHYTTLSQIGKNYFLCGHAVLRGQEWYLPPPSVHVHPEIPSHHRDHKRPALVLLIVLTQFIIEKLHLTFKQVDNLYASQLSLMRNVGWHFQVEALNKAYVISIFPLIKGNNQTDHFSCLAFKRRWRVLNQGKEVIWKSALHFRKIVPSQ